MLKKYQVGSFVFMLIATGRLNSLFTFFFFSFTCYSYLRVTWFTYVFFIIDRNSLVMIQENLQTKSKNFLGIVSKIKLKKSSSFMAKTHLLIFFSLVLIIYLS